MPAARRDTAGEAVKQTGMLTAAADAPPARLSWADRLRAVGLLLDREPGRLRDACILDVDGGFAVEAIAEAFPADGLRTPSWVPLSREYSATEIAAAMAAPRRDQDGRGGRRR